MEQRPNPFELIPEGRQAMSALQSYVNDCDLDKSMLELVKIRASQINGCAFCIAMHATDARTDEELAETIAAVIDAGAIGINLEDSLPGSHKHQRSIEEAAHRIRVVRRIPIRRLTVSYQRSRRCLSFSK
jgi:AhpD family alkylhydroperoxidase